MVLSCLGSIRAFTNAYGMATVTHGSTSSPRTPKALQLLSLLNLRNRSGHSLAIPPSRLSRHFTCPSRLQRSRRSPSARAHLLVRDSAGLHKPRWRSAFSPSCRRSIFFHEGTFYVPSAPWASALDATLWTRSAFGTWWQQRRCCTICRECIRINDRDWSAFRRLRVPAAVYRTANAACWTYGVDNP